MEIILLIKPTSAHASTHSLGIIPFTDWAPNAHFVFSEKTTKYRIMCPGCKAQALLLSGRGAGMCTIYTHTGRNLLSVVVYLTCPEIGKSMVSRVNNDVTLGLTNDKWSTPM